jgi:MoaA/NifB/PqqE/SkfB family radical SAM enzyme
MPPPQYSPAPLDAKALAFRKDAVRLKRGEMVAPTMAIIYPTYFCNMRCFGCISNAENARPASIAFDVFHSFLGEFVGIGGESIEFSGGGEPTLHPRFGELINEIAENQLQFGMITNGTRPECVADALAYPNTRYVRVSIYTVNQLENLAKIIESRNFFSSKARVGGKILLGISEIPLLEYLVDEIINTGVDFVSIKCKRNSADDPELLDEERKLSLDNKIKSLVSCYPGKVFGSSVKTYQRGKCWTSPFHTVIDALGDVKICCYYMDRTDDLVVGNLYETNFKELWYSQKHTMVMDNIDWGQCSKYDCRFHQYNQILEEELSGDSSHLAFV